MRPPKRAAQRLAVLASAQREEIIVRNREFYVALLAIVAGGAALLLMRDLPWGTLSRMGPAFPPGSVAVALLATGAWHMLRGTAWPSATRQARTDFRWLNLLPWTVPAALMLLALARPEGLLLRMGPADFAMAELLVLSLLFGATWIAERGALTRLAIPLLLGLLVGMGGVDVSSGHTRWLHEEDPTFIHGVLAGGLIVALRLPVVSFVVGFGLAVQIEEQMRRALFLSKGDLIMFVTRPLSAAFLIIALAIVIAVLVGRFWSRHAQADGPHRGNNGADVML